MSQPRIELIPLRHAVCADASVIQDVLVRILPAAPERAIRRPPLNLGLVLDRSGSMAGLNKIQFAREAAVCAVEQLLPTDRVSVTIFDDVVTTILPNTPATDKAWIVQLLRGIEPGGSTALHAAWEKGATEVHRYLADGRLNRVLLLSDGLANVGVVAPDAIATHVKQWACRGISTTTMGVGRDYNEDLLQAMAASGDGNYYYIESPHQLVDIFQTELQGLVATVGQRVSLGIEPSNGVTLAEVLNDFERTEYGRLKLPNLIAGMPVEVVVRLNVPPVASGTNLCRFRLAWDAPGNGGRHTAYAMLSLPAVPTAQWHMLAANAEVHERVILLRVARLKIQAARHSERGELDEARRGVREAQELLATLVPSAKTEQEAQALAMLEASLQKSDWVTFAKQAKFQHYWRTHDRPAS